MIIGLLAAEEENGSVRDGSPGVIFTLSRQMMNCRGAQLPRPWLLWPGQQQWSRQKGAKVTERPWQRCKSNMLRRVAPQRDTLSIHHFGALPGQRQKERPPTSAGGGTHYLKGSRSVLVLLAHSLGLCTHVQQRAGYVQL